MMEKKSIYPVRLGSTKARWLMAATILASAMAFIDSTALNVVLPTIQNKLKASGTDLFWILNAYLLMLASLILIGGSLGDQLGRKKVFIIGILIFIAGSAACGFATNVHLLIGFRTLQGIGGAFMIPGSLSLITSSITQKDRGKAIGTWSAATTMVTIGGPLLGGALADAGLWRYIFFINVPIGIISILILSFHVEEIKEHGADSKIDFLGAIAIALGLALLTFGFLRTSHFDFKNIQVLISLIAGLIFLIAFIIIEKRSKNPMMPLQLFSNSKFSGANLLTFFLYAGLGGGMLFLSLNLIQVQGYSQLQSGLSFLPFTILMVAVARPAGGLADKYGPRIFLITGPAISGIGLLLLSFVQQTNGPSEYWATYFPGILVFGLGMSFTVAPLTATVMGTVETHFSGTASGINNAVTRISNVFANAVFGALAILFFSAALQTELNNLSLTPTEKQLILNEAVNLGNAQVPSAVSSKKTIIENYYHQSFISSYKKIMRISGGLAFAGALMSFLFIRDIKKQDPSK
jgi:EmrB/QacA subfamily drug resistance transporter